jgi:hypothetical protein
MFPLEKYIFGMRRRIFPEMRIHVTLAPAPRVSGNVALFEQRNGRPFIPTRFLTNFAGSIVFSY